MIMKKIITRNELRDLLTKWQRGQITAEELNSLAGELYPNDEVGYEDWEADGESSVTNEVLAALDMMDMNLMVPEDVPAYLEFLNTPLGSFKEGYSKLRQCLQHINIEDRQVALSKIPFYKAFCE